MNQTIMAIRPFMDRAGVYEYSSVQVNVPQVVAEKVIKWGNANVEDEELYGAEDPVLGREGEIHITILYGLHSVYPQKVKHEVERITSFYVALGETSVFTTNPNFDVVKIDAFGNYLYYLNSRLKNNTENSQCFPSYKPHVTIAYVKKGAADHLVGRSDFVGINWRVNTIVFSSRNGQKTPIRLKSD